MTTPQLAFVAMVIATMGYVYYRIVKHGINKKTCQENSKKTPLLADQETNPVEEEIQQKSDFDSEIKRAENETVGEKNIAETIACLARHILPEAKVETKLYMEPKLSPGWDVSIVHPDGSYYDIFVGGREGLLFYEGSADSFSPPPN